MATKTLKNWLLTNLSGHGRTEVILSKHMVLITGSEELASQHKPESVFLIPSHSRCEPFTTFTAASLLPLSIVFGWPIAEEFIAGAHDMDSHFVETNPRHNLPVLLALTDVWNDCMSSSNNSSSDSGRIVTPFTEALAAYPAFVACMESACCGRKRSSAVASSQSCSPVVIDGGLHGVYDRSLYQSSKIISSEIVMTLDSQLATNADPKLSLQQQQDGGRAMEEVYQAQDALICSMFAHADGLAFGSIDHSSSSFYRSDPTIAGSLNGHSSPHSMSGYEMETSDGNRPSTLLLCGKLDAFACGQLVAMAEHRAVVKAWIWDIDPFSREVGSSLRSKRTELLRHNLEKMMFQDNQGEEDEEDKSAGNSDMNLSTKTILQHYANMYRNQRVYTVKR